MYQQQKVKLAMNINHNEALNQLSMWHNLKGHNVLWKGTDVIGWDTVTFVWLPYLLHRQQSSYYKQPWDFVPDLSWTFLI